MLNLKSIRYPELDAEPPIAALSHNATAYTMTNQPVTFTTSASDQSGIASRSLKVNGATVTLNAAGVGTYIPKTVGTYTAVYTVTDNAENTTTKTTIFTITVDSTKSVAIMPNMTSNTTPAPFVTSSTMRTSMTNYITSAARLLAYTNTTTSSTATNTKAMFPVGGWIQVKLDKQRLINRVELQMAQVAHGACTVSLGGCNNGTSFTILGSVVIPDVTFYKGFTIKHEPTIPYLYYRITFSTLVYVHFIHIYGPDGY